MEIGHEMTQQRMVEQYEELLKGLIQRGIETVSIEFIGPNLLSAKREDIPHTIEFCYQESLSVCAHRHCSLYHDYWKDRGTLIDVETVPDIVLMINAGIWGYQSWLPTLNTFADIARISSSVPSSSNDHTNRINNGGTLFVASAYTLQEAEDDEDTIRTHYTTTQRLISSSTTVNWLWEAELCPFRSTKQLQRTSQVSGRQYYSNHAWQCFQFEKVAPLLASSSSSSSSSRDCIDQKSALVSWSGGKDSCLSLHRARAAGLNVVLLITAMDETGLRARSHGICPDLLIRQAKALGTEIKFYHATWAEYEEKFVATLNHSCVAHAVFGDIDIASHREWEEKVCTLSGLKCVLPLWNEDRMNVVREFIDAGFKAVVVCIDGSVLDQSFVGREFDDAFVHDLPPGVDPCGENGEFHTFAYAGPAFQHPVEFYRVEVKEYVSPQEYGGKTFYFQILAPS